ncbi:MAG: DUF1800 domain-containing protein [Bacteroidota bacterium]
MNRRSFFTDWLTRPMFSDPGSPESLVRPTSGIEPYVPGPTQPWNALRVGHLLRRTTFLPRWADISALLPMTPSAAVDLLLDTPNKPAPPGMANNATESLEGLDVTYRAIIKGEWEGDAGQLRGWQAGVMRDAGLTIAEKMTAFWSGHFATEFVAGSDDYVQAPLLYRQNKLFREHGLGNFKDLVMSVTLDGAMLVYLGGDLNNAGAPNENYGREMMELFTCGLGQYTEGDVQNAARILTGWHSARFSDLPTPNGIFNTYFTPAEHDINGKEFLGVAFPARDASTNTEFLVQRDEVRKLVDTIFEKRGRAVAEFISRKIYRFFVYSNPAISDNAMIASMADVFMQGNFEIRPLMAALLKSAHFYDNSNIGAQIKTPAEFEIGFSRQIGLNSDPSSDMTRMGQTLFDPPNVSGWPGYRDWITTTTYPVRADVALNGLTAASQDALLSLIKSFPDYQTAGSLIDNLCAILLPRPLSAGRKGSLMTKLLAGAPDYEWGQIVDGSPSTAVRNLRDVITTIVQLPDFQLC